VGIHVERVGHVVLRVRNLADSLRFYEDVLGLHEVARRDFGEGPMAFLSTGNAHHDIAVVETGEPVTDRGLHHFALKVGDSLDDLAATKRHIEARGCTIHMALDHHVSQGLYVSDPDGHLIELYVDADPALWHADPTEVAHSDPLTL
jgi:catechol 2,3-dioxygenase